MWQLRYGYGIFRRWGGGGSSQVTTRRPRSKGVLWE
jgi:hypothetical protein